MLTHDPAIRPRLSVILVNYNGWPDTVRLASSLADTPEVAAGSCEVVVVDNDSEGPVPGPFLSHRPGLIVVFRDENGGFAAGVNQGWAESRGAWLLVLNPDVVPGPDFLAEILRRLDALDAAPGPPAGVVGFGLRNVDGSRQGSVGAFPSLARAAWEQFIPRTRRKYQAAWRTKAGPVDWVTGACMLVARTLLDRLGGMDDDFFLYHEEVALCRSAWLSGWSVLYDPTVEVIHLHPLQNRPISPKMRVITRHSKLLYFRKYLPRWQFLALDRVVTAEALAMTLWARATGRDVEARSWAAVRQVAGRLRRGDTPSGREVREIADRVEGIEAWAVWPDDDD